MNQAGHAENLSLADEAVELWSRGVDQCRPLRRTSGLSFCDSLPMRFQMNGLASFTGRALLCALLLGLFNSTAQSSTWIGPDTETWGNAANWDLGAPNAVGAVANSTPTPVAGNVT